MVLVLCWWCLVVVWGNVEGGFEGVEGSWRWKGGYLIAACWHRVVEGSHRREVHTYICHLVYHCRMVQHLGLVFLGNMVDHLGMRHYLGMVHHLRLVDWRGPGKWFLLTAGDQLELGVG